MERIYTVEYSLVNEDGSLKESVSWRGHDSEKQDKLVKKVIDRPDLGDIYMSSRPKED
tara:strand:- start:722 stop:895 length:174 start_codon:yes stop_codon:yes gene_type:complete